MARICSVRDRDDRHQGRKVCIPTDPSYIILQLWIEYVILNAWNETSSSQEAENVRRLAKRSCCYCRQRCIPLVVMEATSLSGHIGSVLRLFNG